MSRSLFSQKRQAEIIKDVGKRYAKKFFPELDKKITQYLPTWSSAKPMLRHFLKTCVEVRLLQLGYPLSHDKAA
ncbi:hypothetical protein HF908_08740 [Ralstonia pseudosolanacearum]|uniref:hypothetical protein n=1 Tax=Ralstonia pseudosolanacearum TaxID=1310165 RepID=UPI0018667E81|nr:hypothetical protein [Ralstonia pseudosolanacearum]QOK91554.1 hypothetical protein HF908_08740 [Ralstonia pseudosolanacearum]